MYLVVTLAFKKILVLVRSLEIRPQSDIIAFRALLPSENYSQYSSE
jgi:hypothetical protein